MGKNNFYIGFILFSLFTMADLNEQVFHYYYVQLTDKNHSQHTIDQPQNFLSPRALLRRTNQQIAINNADIPVSQFYIDSLQKLGFEVWLKSKWLNAVVIYTDTTTIKQVTNQSFVVSHQRLTRVAADLISPLKSIQQQSAVAINYGNAANQITMIGIDQMHKDGFAGQGMQVAVLDAGFSKANQLKVFDSLFVNNRILGTYDYVKKETTVYEDHEHGMEVLSVLAGYSEGNLVGGAYKASFYLLRTEDNNSESPLEEFNWAVAAEFSDSIGVDVISSSLGYTDFDTLSLSHHYSEFNGKTTIAARAAKMAASKGILVCVSAGNDGANAWKHISTPADADSIITVGAVDSQGKYAYFSSIGPSADNRIKPDLVTKGLGAWVATTSGTFGSNNGTSFSCPILAGLATGYWSAFPNLTSQEVIQNLKLSASQYLNPDNYLGYGIPNYSKAKNIVLGDVKQGNALMYLLFPNPVDENNTLVIRMLDNLNELIVFVYHADGSLVLTKPVAQVGNDIFLDVSSLAKGVYFLKVQNVNQSKTVPFVK
jgi:subtilisin family serine protease